MKVTGIVRRVDDLGRIVIPKEIRRSLRIKEGDPLEIFISRDGEIIFKKYDGEIIFKKYDDGQAANEWIEGNSIK
jgi:stage V sporulation protein T